MRRGLWFLLALLPALAGAAEAPRLAVVGGFRMGFAGVLKRAGLPVDLLDSREQCEVEVLARYDAVLAGGAWFDEAKADWSPDALRALDTYVRRGGRLLCEVGSEPPCLRELLGEQRLDWGSMEEPKGRSFRLEPGDHRFLRRFAPRRTWPYGALVRHVAPADDAGLTVLARFVEGPEKGRPAIVSLPVGQGEILYVAGIVGYIQGNWHPAFEDLILGCASYLTDGRAVPRWDNAATAEPAPPPLEPPPLGPAPALPAGFEPLGEPPADGYAISLPASDRRLVLENRTRLTVAGGRVEVTCSGQPALSATTAGRVVVLRTPGRLRLLAAGRVIAEQRRPEVIGGACGADRAEGVTFQPLEPLAFGDDFTRDGPLVGDWRRISGRWFLTGTGEPYRRVPEFALRGRRGTAEVGWWFWTEYRAAATVRPLGAREARLQVGRVGDSWAELRCPVGKGQPVLVAVDGGHERELARGGPALIDRQWARLALTLADGRLIAEMDGQRILEAQTDRALGAVGVGFEAGEGLIDDVAVEAVVDPPLPRVHPPSYDKGPDGLLDRDTWSHPSAAWTPDARAPRMWHTGRFVGDWRLRLPIARAGGPASLTVHVGPDRAPSPAVSLADEALVDGATLAVERRDGRLRASIDDRPIAVATTAGDCLGLEWAGLRLSPAAVVIEAADVTEVTFHRAPDAWWEAAGTWLVGARWPCQPQWAWLTGEGTPDAVWWHKHRLLGDGVVRVFLGVRMQGHMGGETAEPFERLRVTVCGDGRDPQSGYQLELGGQPGKLTRLYRRGQVVATSTLAMPEPREVHNYWGDLRIERVGAELHAWYGDRPLLRWTDPEPLGDGQVALATERNVLATPYVAVYGRIEADLRPLPRELVDRRWRRRQLEAARVGVSFAGLASSFRRLVGFTAEPPPPR